MPDHFSHSGGNGHSRSNVRYTHPPRIVEVQPPSFAGILLAHRLADTEHLL